MRLPLEDPHLTVVEGRHPRIKAHTTWADTLRAVRSAFRHGTPEPVSVAVWIDGAGWAPVATYETEEDLP